MVCLCVSLCGRTQVTVVEIMGNHLFFKSIASQVEKHCRPLVWYHPIVFCLASNQSFIVQFLSMSRFYVPNRPMHPPSILCLSCAFSSKRESKR